MADQGSEGLLSPFLRNRRIFAARPFLRGRILDIGCGSGELARYVDASAYFGVDIDRPSIEIARQTFPVHDFYSELPKELEKFDTIVALAVIEHVPEPEDFLRSIAAHLRCDDQSRIICTTPHPMTAWIHGIGSRVGLFSRSANEEHEELMDRYRLISAGLTAGLSLVRFDRFLLGANQIAVFGRQEL